MHHNHEVPPLTDQPTSLYRWLEGFARAASLISPAHGVQQWMIDQKRTRQ
jgi:hypothetical protein